MGGAAHVERLGGPEDKGASLALLFLDELQLAVIMRRAVLQRLDDLGPLAQQGLHQPHAVFGGLAETVLAGENDHVALIAFALHKTVGSLSSK